MWDHTYLRHFTSKDTGSDLSPNDPSGRTYYSPITSPSNIMSFLREASEGMSIILRSPRLFLPPPGPTNLDILVVHDSAHSRILFHFPTFRRSPRPLFSQSWFYLPRLTSHTKLNPRREKNLRNAETHGLIFASSSRGSSSSTCQSALTNSTPLLSPHLYTPSTSTS